MDIIRNELFKSLETGFINSYAHSKFEYRPQLLVNDKKYGKKVLTSIDAELKSCEEFWFSVAFITTSGIATIHNTLIDLEEKGVQARILASQYLNFTQPEALRKLLKFKNIDLRIAADGDFHSKGYLFKSKDIYSLIIGSSNFTASAFCSNKELNIKISATSESEIIRNAIKEFKVEFENAIKVDEDFISIYSENYFEQRLRNKRLEERFSYKKSYQVEPNQMQIEALSNLQKIRETSKKKALLISATGTGKTYLSAFDVKIFKPKKFLFIVHRKNIAEAALRTFKSVLGDQISMGYFSGGLKDLDCDYIFSTIQTISIESNLRLFHPDYFEYIVIDETHRAGASSYQKVIEYFNPKFLLGMTATPERTDGYDIFKSFDYNIAYEIRLQRALEEGMLCPFHYYGVTDISVDGQVLEDNTQFALLCAEERLRRIVETIQKYGCDDGVARGLVFCSSIQESDYFSFEFNKLGFKTVSLTGESSDLERANAISLLESDDVANKLDYIFTRDIFNEGIDIPKVNQIILLRPTQSAIVFVQQLGRGLRKVENKEYLTVIDFIGNYSNNYMVPIALYGDNSYNKDSLRKLISNGSRLIPGDSTINFDKIAIEKIYSAIDSANLLLYRDLVNDYKLMKYKLGRVPMMLDYIEMGSRDPMHFVEYSKSYFNFIKSIEKEYIDLINESESKLLEFLSMEILNEIRIFEPILLLNLIESDRITIIKFKGIIKSRYSIDLDDKTIESVLNNLNGQFVTEKSNKKLVSIGEKYGIKVVKLDDQILSLEESFSKCLTNRIFKLFLMDSLDFCIKTYDSKFKRENFVDGFLLYSKYSRKDVFRILNWAKNPVAQNVGGYIIAPDKSNCPVFVNYHKSEDISNSTKYEDGFLNNEELQWMSKSNRKLTSPDVETIKNFKNHNLRMPLFIKKSNGESNDFYFMGDSHPKSDSLIETFIKNDEGEEISVVKMVLNLSHPVEDSLYDYLINR